MHSAHTWQTTIRENFCGKLIIQFSLWSCLCSCCSDSKEQTVHNENRNYNRIMNSFLRRISFIIFFVAVCKTTTCGKIQKRVCYCRLEKCQPEIADDERSKQSVMGQSEKFSFLIKKKKRKMKLFEDIVRLVSVDNSVRRSGKCSQQFFVSDNEIQENLVTTANLTTCRIAPHFGLCFFFLILAVWFSSAAHKFVCITRTRRIIWTKQWKIEKMINLGLCAHAAQKKWKRTLSVKPLCRRNQGNLLWSINATHLFASLANAFSICLILVVSLPAQQQKNKQKKKIFNFLAWFSILCTSINLILWSFANKFCFSVASAIFSAFWTKLKRNSSIIPVGDIRRTRIFGKLRKKSFMCTWRHFVNTRFYLFHFFLELAQQQWGKATQAEQMAHLLFYILFN